MFHFSRYLYLHLQSEVDYFLFYLICLKVHSEKILKIQTLRVMLKKKNSQVEFINFHDFN